MKFYRQPLIIGQKKLSDQLLGELGCGKRVLWFVSGGSNIPTAVTVMNNLIGSEEKLIICLCDERYGPPGHPDSNWQQLLNAGLRLGKAKTYSVLGPDLSLVDTALRFDQSLHRLFDEADVAIGQLGMGADGHIAGILPESPATVETAALAIGYHSDQFDRLTMTFRALQRLDAAYCFVYGHEKQAAIVNLQTDNLSLDVQPAQILKRINQSYVYNEYLESEGSRK